MARSYSCWRVVASRRRGRSPRRLAPTPHAADDDTTDDPCLVLFFSPRFDQTSPTSLGRGPLSFSRRPTTLTPSHGTLCLAPTHSVPYASRPSRSHVRSPWLGPLDNLDRLLRGRGFVPAEVASHYHWIHASAFLNHWTLAAGAQMMDWSYPRWLGGSHGDARPHSNATRCPSGRSPRCHGVVVSEHNKTKTRPLGIGTSRALTCTNRQHTRGSTFGRQEGLLLSDHDRPWDVRYVF